MLVISIIGAMDSLYLTITHFTQSALVCTVIEGCDVVLKSSYSSIGPVPTAMLGVIFYIAIFYIVLLFISDNISADFMRSLGWLFGAGFVASLIFLYLQMFVINAYCQYCLLSLLTSISLFVLFFFRSKKDVTISNEQ